MSAMGRSQGHPQGAETGHSLRRVPMTAMQLFIALLKIEQRARLLELAFDPEVDLCLYIRNASNF